ncbi:MAG: hypothetical protein A3J24_10230 [Deltaproteobacteria bacterium RIFCSPLOWO2_02_FULL_53_8]|nr:MAG: hypothetical protein A3J24_10230 [Deltaproteobacteria bacterium RIFCSPLOWO2_02_FULL_53_8]
MKIYNLNRLAEPSPDGTYRLGPKDLHTEAVELLYGRLRPKETGRIHTTPIGIEEIICVVKGSMHVNCAKSAFTVCTGEAFLSKEGGSLTFTNTGESETIYITTSGRLSCAHPAARPIKPPAPQAGIPAATTAEPIVDAPEYDITRDDSNTVD